MGAGSQSFGPSSTAFPGHRQGWEAGPPVLILDPGMFKARILAARPSHQAFGFPLNPWKTNVVTLNRGHSIALHLDIVHKEKPLLIIELLTP